MIRLGLCCSFQEEQINFQTTTVAALSKMTRRLQMGKLSTICLHNARAVLTSLQYCAANRIGSFRLSSNLFPIKTHDEFGYHINDLFDWDKIADIYEQCRVFASTHKIRLGLHPGQFVIMNSTDEALTQRSLSELEHHAEVAEMTGADTMNIHVGGMYGNKTAALEQLANNLEDIPNEVYSRLTLENDDKTFTVEDLYPWCHRLGIPMVYDVHHDRCNPGSIGVAEATEIAWETWRDREPLMHISSPLGSGRDVRSHHERINPQDWPREWNNTLGNFTVEIEAKGKEVAIRELQTALAARGILESTHNDRDC